MTQEQVKESLKECTDLETQPEPATGDKKEEKSTNITFYANLESVNLLNADALKTYPNITRPVHEVNLRFTRGIPSDKIEVGQSVALFGLNYIDEVLRVIGAFGWKENELIGNRTVKETLIDVVDIRTYKVNLEKMFKDVKGTDEAVAAFKAKYSGTVTLLDLAEEYILDETLKTKMPIPQYMIEESHIIPRLKPRFYSITNDPFPKNELKTDFL